MSVTSIQDYESIVKTLNKYAEGSAAGKSEIMKPAFHLNATMYGYLGDAGLIEGSIQNLYDFIDSNGPSPNLKSKIDILHVDGTAATTRVMVEDLYGSNFTDFHHLLKINGEWKIISKIFHQHN